jgi:carboxymethylenebutenolidase
MRHRMLLDAGWTRFDAGGEPADAYLARPAAARGALPAVLVIQEIWAVDAHIRDLVERFATAGYAAFAPDLYSRGGKPEVLAPERVDEARAFLDGLPPSSWFDVAARDAAASQLPEPRRDRLRETLAVLLTPNRPIERWLATLRAALAFLRASHGTAGRRVGCVGYCLGGHLAALLAASEEVSACVVHYGASPPPDVAARIRCPVLGLYGEDDPRIVGGVPAFVDAVRATGGRIDTRIYPRTPHAFFNDTRPSYRAEAARDAWARTLVFLAEHLAP